MTDLPPGWARATLGDLVSTKSGNSKLIKGKLHGEPAKGRVQAYSASGPDVWCDSAEWDGPGVVLSAVGARCGKAFLADGHWTAIANTHVLVPRGGVSTRFLWYRLNDESFWVKGGSAQPFVKMKASKELPIPLPPLAEQERIVAAIEEHLSHLDAAEASLYRAQHNLDRLRSSALASMFASGWKRSPLVELAADDRPICYGILKPKTERPGVVPYVEVRSIQNGEIDVESLHRTTQELHDEFRRSELREGDVVFAVRGSWDRAAVVPAELAGANVSRDVARVSPHPTRLRAEFLNLFLHSPEARRFFAAHARGVAVKGVNIGDLRHLPTPAPSLDEQDAMVARAQDEEQRARRVAAEASTAYRRAGHLRRAILAAAFSGQLVPQDPADEPASVLLDRIRAEAPMKKSTRKKTSA